jgi:hypothetical protein
MPPALLALIIFEIGSHIFPQASLDHKPSIYAPHHSWDDHTQVLVEQDLLNFLPGLASNLNPPNHYLQGELE